MRIFVGLETEAKPRFLNHEDPRAWSLTDLETVLSYGNVKAQKISLLSSKSLLMVSIGQLEHYYSFCSSKVTSVIAFLLAINCSISI